MRIALMISAVGHNGAAGHALMLTRHLLERGHGVALLHRPGAWIAAQDGLAQATKMPTTFKRNARELKRVTRLLNGYAPDLIHTHMSSAHTYGALARLFGRRPVVATAHSMSVQLHWMFNTLVIATSPQAARFHAKVNRVPARAIRTVPNFIETRAFNAIDEMARAEARDVFGLRANALVIGSVGQIDGRKRQADLVRAMPEILRQVPEALLFLVGANDTDYARELQTTAEQLGVTATVVLPGVRPDIRSAYAAMDVFALSSMKETGPLSVLEAMACGLPVVATDVGLVSDFVEEGLTGHVVPIGDIAAMAQRLVALANSSERRAEMGRAGRARVLNKFDAAAGLAQTEAILEEASRMPNRAWLGGVSERIGT